MSDALDKLSNSKGAIPDRFDGEIRNFSKIFVDVLDSRSSKNIVLGDKGVTGGDIPVRIETGLYENAKKEAVNLGILNKGERGDVNGLNDIASETSFITEDVDYSEAKEIVQNIASKASKDKFKETAEKVAESENVDLFTKIVKPVGAVMTVITAIITIRKLRN